MSPEERSAYLKSLGCRVVEPGESPQPLSIIGVQAPPEKKEPTPMKKALRLLRSRGVKINEGGKGAKPISIVGARAPKPPDPDNKDRHPHHAGKHVQFSGRGCGNSFQIDLM